VLRVPIVLSAAYGNLWHGVLAASVYGAQFRMPYGALEARSEGASDGIMRGGL
jgi:hypothetical protein